MQLGNRPHTHKLCGSSSPGRCSTRLSLLSRPHPVGSTRKPRSKTHTRLAEVIHPSEPVSGVGVGVKGVREVGDCWGVGSWGCWTPQPQSWCLDGLTSPKLSEELVSHEHRPGGLRVGEEAATPRILGGPGSCIPAGTLGGLVCWSLLAKETWEARCRAGGLPAGLGWGPPGHRAWSPQAGCPLPGARERSLPDRAVTVGTGQGTLHGLSPEQAREQGCSALCGRTPSWRGAAGPEARVGAEVPTGWPPCRGIGLASLGTPAGKARRTRGPGSAGAGRQQPQ